MKRYSSALAVVLLLLLATGVMSATAVPVGQMSFSNDAGDQSFTLFNYASVMTDVYPVDALSFENLALTVTFAGGGLETRVLPGFLMPSTSGYTKDDGTNSWRWNSVDHGVITSATLTGTISPKSFQFGGAMFSSTGVLSASLDLSSNNLDFFFSEPVDITVSDAPAPSPVPEPGTLALLAGPVIAFAFRRIRK